MGKQELNVKGTMDFAGLTVFLEDFLASFKAKKVCVQRGTDYVTLTPTDVIEVEIEAAVKKGKQKISLELSWKEEVLLAPDSGIKVSTVEPQPPVVEEPAAPEAGCVCEEAAPALVAEGDVLPLTMEGKTKPKAGAKK